jgi:hypothetical protein
LEAAVAEQVQILAKASGCDIEVREVATPAEAVRFRYPDGTPPTLAGALIEGLALMRADTAGLRTEHGRKLPGRRPPTFGLPHLLGGGGCRSSVHNVARRRVRQGRQSAGQGAVLLTKLLTRLPETVEMWREVRDADRLDVQVVGDARARRRLGRRMS